MDWVSMNPSKEIISSISPPPPLSITKFESKISPSILLIIVILAVIFFVSGILHLLVRFLLRPTVREPEDSDNGTALQGQLQELFHLHDAGVDQSFIDTLPVFLYKAIIGLKDPFDCAVCLSEFEPQDKLRLLPKCSHAFHIECIDTWLLSHSTCPLCRRSLFPDYSPAHNSFNPVVLVLESGSESSREFLASNREEPGLNQHLGLPGENDFTPRVSDSSRKTSGVVIKEELSSASFGLQDEKVVSVKLGKFRNVDIERGGEGSSTGNRNFEKSQRRCFSMGSYEYVMDESCMLQVALNSIKKKKLSVKRPGYRSAMSECGCHPRREEFRALDEFNSSELRANNASNLHKKESFSVSKIWLQPRQEKAVFDRDSSRRAFSFRSPLHGFLAEDSKKKRFNSGEEWEKSGSEMDLDVEVGSCVNSSCSQIEQTPSFARRTLLWIVGRQNKVGSNHL
ncbi:RING-H2 finger protein ATL13-like [Dendrobium catenatum]|uniref:RING-type E3 ubiquitin transferase n=1 Tax=Dendrobium catenatum TaxID=906689 RepID=A0A2I0VTK8_9ASPA|nr:RING-H2 finger protein ATL13-like [Dendrobium catenatum]PKU66757.1 RING-H2 finger protein ATL13 [Dendrobium catenatum]